MIKSKADYYDYLKQDEIANGFQSSGVFQSIVNIITPNPIKIFLKRLRKAEYYKNTKSNIFSNAYYFYLRYLLKKSSVKLGFSIPENVFGPGLALVHYGTIVINAKCKIGKNCRMHAGVNIGASGGEKEAPQLGDNVYIAPGAKIYGNISIPNNTAIGANAVVNKSFDEENTVIAGIPAKVIGKVDIKKIIRHV
ncbi:MAG: serine acetyltransferase [Algibacter sp.]|uniref:serine O-acetyltransferase n=1 Tax=Algibacter sp. TaxID=1872428 RepID=UPI002632C72D|nr:serine acetyltransferase [Algibacter sp.]MDG1730904.1 serine acetyltransferase [Algibacter sp.]MDG2179406.1 serine acetyltransferase [Algibacter sp.]